MKKNKLTQTQKRASAKKGQKRAERLKKTQSEKHVKQIKTVIDGKRKEKKFRESMDKLIQDRYAK